MHRVFFFLIKTQELLGTSLNIDQINVSCCKVSVANGIIRVLQLMTNKFLER